MANIIHITNCIICIWLQILNINLRNSFVPKQSIGYSFHIQHFLLVSFVYTYTLTHAHPNSLSKALFILICPSNILSLSHHLLFSILFLQSLFYQTLAYITHKYTHKIGSVLSIKKYFLYTNAFAKSKWLFFYLHTKQIHLFYVII